jgi:hypothetical protein
MHQDLRNQLLALGIPLGQQDTASLSSKFPPEFKVAALGLSQTDIAEVLVAFVKRGLISVSSLSESDTVRRSMGGHVCHFYRDEEEMVRMTAAFLEEGLRTGERCLWVLPGWLSAARARAAAHAARSGFDNAEASGRLSLLAENDVYLDANGVLRSAQGIIEFWLGEEQKARAAGFFGIRITGDGTGLVSTDSWQSGVDYERLADAAFKGRRVTALCTYSLTTGSPARLAEVLSGHACGYMHHNGALNQIRSGAGVATAIQFMQAVPRL